MKIILSFLILFVSALTFAQDTEIKKARLTDAVTERITVLKADKATRQGFYQAFIKNTNRALAMGNYNNNKRVGVWSYFDTNNQLIQRFNYTTNTLLYEAPEDSTSNCRYVVDDSLTTRSVTTKPVRIGDRLYGYIPYLLIFRLPHDIRDINPNLVNVTLELLVSPGGRLADYTVHIQNNTYQRKFSFNLDLLSDEDKTFVPATIDGRPVSCRIFVKCFLTDDGRIDFF